MHVFSNKCYVKKISKNIKFFPLDKFNSIPDFFLFYAQEWKKNIFNNFHNIKIESQVVLSVLCVPLFTHKDISAYTSIFEFLSA